MVTRTLLQVGVSHARALGGGIIVDLIVMLFFEYSLFFEDPWVS